LPTANFFFRLVGPGPFIVPRQSFQYVGIAKKAGVSFIPICWDSARNRPFSFQFVGIGQKTVFPQFQFVGIVHKSLVKRELQMIRFHSDMLGLLGKRWFLDSNLLGSRQKTSSFSFQYVGIPGRPSAGSFQYVGIAHKSLVDRILHMKILIPICWDWLHNWPFFIPIRWDLPRSKRLNQTVQCHVINLLLNAKSVDIYEEK
jgi:hypothetical protein